MKTKNTNNTTTTTEVEEEISTGRKRTPRRKTYERHKESEIPQYVIEHFKKDDYDLRFVRWSILGEPDYRYLSRMEQEGFEFVTKDELPDEYVRTLRVRDSDMTKGMLTNGGDLVLMKIDSDLRKDRQKYFEERSRRELDSVDINVIEKRGNLRNVGSRSKVMLREPSFQE